MANWSIQLAMNKLNMNLKLRMFVQKNCHTSDLLFVGESSRVQPMISLAPSNVSFLTDFIRHMVKEHGQSSTIAFVDRSTAEDSVPDGSHRIMLFQNTLSSIFSKYVILKQKIYNSIPSFFMVQLEITEY